MDAPQPEIFKPRWTLADAVRPGLRALGHFWRPFLVIQVLAACLVFAYRKSEAVQAVCAHIMVWKESGGLWFAALGGLVAGVVIPAIARRFVPGERLHGKRWWWTLLFQCAFFSLSSVTVDLFYQGQSIWFGDGTDFQTVAIKVVMDQVVYSQLFALPFAAVLFHWWRLEFDVRATLRDLNGQFYLQRVVPIMIPGFAYWIPMVISIYSMPPLLQFPLFILVGAAWNLILVFVATGMGDKLNAAKLDPSAPPHEVVTPT